jgi:tRNA pseudouridine38-40 synthase
MPSFKLTLAYDGTNFVGWQRQASGVSVQSLLEDALCELDGRTVTVSGAGRTDAGVHALGQVASFSLDRTIGSDALSRAVNARLPKTVRVVSAIETSPAFHARFAARAKTYRYRIWNGPVISPFEHRYAWHIAGPLDVSAMCAAARRIEGRHDFASFQAAGSTTTTTERTILASHVRKRFTAENAENAEDKTCSGIESDGFDLSVLRAGQAVARSGAGEQRLVLGGEGFITYEITGDGFLRHMVRTIVGTLVEIGRARRGVDWIDEVLASRDRAAAGPTAPAAGLFLVAVDYGDALAGEP